MGKIGLKGVRNPDLYGDPRYTQLQQDAATNPEVALFLKIANSGLSAPGTYDTEAYFTPRVDNQWRELGQSVYDPTYMIGNDASEILENRAYLQPGIMQLLNGLLKGAVTAGTTFLDNTIGFLYGLGTGAYNVYDLNLRANDTSFKENAYAFIKGMWDNDFNKEMSNIQDKMEEIAPNYYSQAELENPWYTNILSTNFIGDKVLKNMGFTQGAILAMAATEGLGLAKLAGSGASAITKFTLGNAGKALGASRGTLAGINSIARNSGQLAHHAFLSAIGASGEASIEAINAVKEGSKDAYENLAIRRQELIDNLDPNSPTYYEDLSAIDAAVLLYKNQIDAKFRDAGNSVYLANMAILSVSNALEFAPLIKGGFQRSAKLTDFERRLGERTVGANEWALGILRGEKASIVNTVDTGVGRTLGKTALNAFTEGMEEASQNLASNSNLMQAKAKLNLYADNTLLGARINPEVSNELADYTKSFSKALYDNFGRPESLGWEEFFLGALTGGIGFIGLSNHAVKNENGEQMYDPKTHAPLTSWKPRSITDLFLGGYFGARRELQEEYDENQLIVDAVNKRLSDPEFIKRTQHAIASRTLSKQMDEALTENDMFKFKNSEIGKLADDVFFFRDKGMIDEYKSIYQAMTNIDDKTLQLLYTATADIEGNTELAQEDLEKVREEYQGKAKRNLEKINMIQDYYDFVDLEYRDRSLLFKEELAYLYVRLDDTRRRIQELEDEDERPNRIKSTVLGLLDASNILVNDDNIPTTFKLNYESSIQGLTDSEKNDLKRLKRQERIFVNRINDIKRNPAKIDALHSLIYDLSKKDFESKDTNSLVERIKNANSVSEINTILGNSDNSVRQEILNRVYQEGDVELKNKLKAQISASSVYARSLQRLEKVWSKENAKILNDAMQELLARVYLSNDLNLNEVKQSLENIKNELSEDSIDTIARLLPDSYDIFEHFLGEEHTKEKAVFQNVLEGAIEDVGYGVIAARTWEGQQLARIKAQEQQKLSEQKAGQEEERKTLKAKSFEEAVAKTTYVKKIDGIDIYKEAFEKFGVLELDSIIYNALNDTVGADNETSIKNITKYVKRILAKDNPLEAIKKLQKALKEQKDNGKTGDPALSLVLDKMKLKYEGKKPSTQVSKNASFKALMKLLKEADKKEDVDTVNSIVKQISSDIQGYAALGAKDSDFEYIAKLELKYKNKLKAKTSDNINWFILNEVSLESSEKDGVKTTKFTWWRTNKEDKLIPTVGGGLSIDVNAIDENSLDTEDVEKPVLTELREKDGKFTGTIRYSLKGQKGRIEADVKFKSDPTKTPPKSQEKKDKKGDTVGGSPVALSYLLENGPGTIKSTGYLLHAISAAYEAVTDEIEEIRDKYLNQLDDNPENFKNDTTGALKEVRDIINLAYGKLGLDILDTILENATGFHAKEGKKIEAQLEALNAAIKKEDEDLDVDVEDKIILSDSETQTAVNKFYKSKHLDPNNLSIEEQQEIIANIEKALDLIAKKQEIPEELLPYAEIIMSTNILPTAIKGPETPSTEALNDNELNGAFLGLYDVGNLTEGRPNKLQLMDADVPDNLKSINYFYGSLLHAEQVLWCIDNILKDLKASNTPIRMLADASKSNVLYPAVKATEELKKKAKNRWLVNTNDGEYIIIGTLGFNNSSKEQLNLWQEIRDSITSQLSAAGLTSGFYVSAEDKHIFKINNIGDGRPAKSHYQHTSTKSIVELIAGTDKERNPLNITLKTLKWQIIYPDEPKSVHVNNGDKIRGNANLNAGKVYVLVPTPSGAYYRHPINPITIDEVNKNSKFYKKIDKLIEDIIKNKEVKDVIKLKNNLVLESDTQEISYLDIYFNDDGIRVKYIPRQGEATSVILSEEQEDAIEELKEIIYSQIRPLVSITLAHLDSPNTIKELNEAGALQLKGSLGMFSYVGANYTVIPYNEATNSKLPARRASSLENTSTEIRYKGELIFKIGNDYYSNDELITDKDVIESLNDISAINDGLYTEESLWEHRQKGKGKNAKWILKPLEGVYYFIQKGTSTVVYHKDTKGNITKLSAKEAKKAINTRELNENYRISKEREEAQNKGIGISGEDISIDDEELDDIEESKKEKETSKKLKTEPIEKNKLKVGDKVIVYMSNGNPAYTYSDGTPIVGTVTSMDTEFEGGTPLVNIPKVGEVLLTESNLAGGTRTIRKVIEGSSSKALEQSPVKERGLDAFLKDKRTWIGDIITNIQNNRDFFTEEKAFDYIKRAFQEREEPPFKDSIIRLAILELGLPKDDSSRMLQRKQDAVKKAIYDVQLKLGVGIGDSVSRAGKEYTIMTIDFDENALQRDLYSYSDISGTVTVILQDKEGVNYLSSVDSLLNYYEKINKVPQKPLKGLDNSKNNSNFVARLLDSSKDTLAIEDILYEKAAEIAEQKDLLFDENCSINDLVLWFKDNVGFDLDSIPNNASNEVILDLINNCK